MRSLALACAIKGGKEIAVIGHTDCQVGKTTTMELIERLSAEAIEITKIPAIEFTVLIYELERDAIGRSGRTCADIMAELK